MYLCKDVYERIDKVELYDRHFEKKTHREEVENVFCTWGRTLPPYYEEYEVRTVRRECQRSDGLCIRIRKYNVNNQCFLITRHTRFKCNVKVGIEKTIMNGHLERTREYHHRKGNKKQLRTYDNAGQIEVEQNFDIHNNMVCRHVRNRSGIFYLRSEWVYDYSKYPPEFVAEYLYQPDGRLSGHRFVKRQKVV
jgi:hypothetical protein